MTSFAVVASEGGHWYDRSLRQVETVESAKGQPIRPDIRHARKLDFAPGVTTILKAADKPALTAYLQRQAIMSALTLPREAGESDDTYVARVLADSKEHARQAADLGTEIHAAVEIGIRDGAAPTKHAETVRAIQTTLEMTMGSRSWRTESVAVSYLGYGTKSDLHSAAAEGRMAVVLDLKTKDGDTADQKLWDEHPEQLAATARALHDTFPGDGYDRAVCGIIFVSRTIPGNHKLVLALPEQVVDGMARFRALLRYWQLKNRHRPTWAREDA